MSARTGVVLLAMGGPDSLDAVRPFLRNLFSDPLIFPVPFGRFLAPIIAWRRAPEARRYYERLGGRSPLIEGTERQAAALAAVLEASDPGEFRVAAAYRYWGRTAREAVQLLGCERIVALPMYPQYCRATTLSSFEDLDGVTPALTIDRFGEDPAYLDALAATVRPLLDGLEDPVVLMSAHGVPVSLVEKGDPYVHEVAATAKGLAARLPGKTRWSLAWQSKVGPMRWVEPSTEDAIRALAREGARQLVLVPLTFVTEHVETLDELDVRMKEVALRAGFVEVRRAPVVGESPAFIDALASLVRRRASVQRVGVS